MSAWTKFVTEFYKKEHAKNPDYKFKNAMKDAAKVYKKTASSDGAASGKTMKKSRKSRKSRKARKSRKQ
jgi:hypothetical protein